MGFPALLRLLSARISVSINGLHVALQTSVNCAISVGSGDVHFSVRHNYLPQTKSLRWAFAAGLMNSLSFNQLLFEHIIVAEALARFLLIWTFWQYQTVMESKDNWSLRPFILLGFMMGCTFLTRADLLPMAAVLMLSLFLNCRINRSPSQSTALILSYSLPVFITVAGLCSFNKITTGAFSPGNELGFALVADHPQMVEWAPDEYADFRDAYVKIAGDGPKPDYSGALWQAYDTVHKKTGISIVSFNKRLIAMAVRIFINHPKEYIETVAVGWYQFFQPLPVFYSAQCRCSNEFRMQAMALFGRLQAAVNPFVMTIFLAACINELVAYATAVKRAGQWAICLQQTAIVIVLLQSLCIAMIAPILRTQPDIPFPHSHSFSSLRFASAGALPVV